MALRPGPVIASSGPWGVVNHALDRTQPEAERRECLAQVHEWISEGLRDPHHTVRFACADLLEQLEAMLMLDPDAPKYQYEMQRSLKLFVVYCECVEGVLRGRDRTETEAHAKRGRAIVAGARQGHTEVHGSEEEKMVHWVAQVNQYAIARGAGLDKPDAIRQAADMTGRSERTIRTTLKGRGRPVLERLVRDLP